MRNCELMRLRDETLIGVSVFLRILQGVGAAIAETLIISFMIEGAPSEKIAQIFASVEVTCGLGFVIHSIPVKVSLDFWQAHLWVLCCIHIQGLKTRIS